MISSSPAIGSDGTIYFGCDDEKIYVLSPDGTLKWNWDVGDLVSSSPAISSDGVIYFGSYDKKLYALNPDGTLKWSYATGGMISSSPAIGSDGTIYFGSYDKKLYALNPDGSLKWSYTTGGMIFTSSPAIGSDSTIYVGSTDKKLYALNSDGTLKWSFLTGGGIDSSAAIDFSGTVYISSFGIYALNPDGTLKWSHITGSYFRSSPAISSDGSLYLGSLDKVLYAFGSLDDNIAPIISEVASSSISQASAIITWATDEAATSNIEYGLATSYGSSAPAVADTTADKTSHSINLSGLSPNTTYHYQVKSRDAAGNETVSADFTLLTLADTSPVISGVTSSDITAGLATITWETDEAATSNIEYGLTTSYGSMSPAPADTIAEKTSHKVVLNGLSPGTIYHYSVKSKDAGGKEAISADFSFKTLDAVADHSWSMFRHDPQHTARSPYSGPSSPVLKWSYATDYSIYSSPAIGSDGTIYIGSDDDKLYAINPDGSFKWSYITGSSVQSTPGIGSDGTVYVGSYDGWLYALKPDGSLKWRYGTGGSVSSSPAIGFDGTIYVGSLDKKLYALNPDGTFRWSYGTGGSVSSSPAIGSAGTIYVGSADYNLYALNPDGSLKWSYATGGPVYSSPAIGTDGTIYFGSYDNKVYALNPDGSLKWSYTTWGMIYSSPAIGLDDTIYIGSYDNKLYALNPDGILKWSYATGGIDTSPAIDSDGTIYVHRYGYLYALNPDGTLKWSWATGAVWFSSPAISSDGTIYVGSFNNNLYAIGEATKPTADFESAPLSGTEPLVVAFTDLSASSDGIVSWLWDFGDGHTSMEQNPHHTYRHDGKYTVSLTVTNTYGTSAMETKADYITVHDTEPAAAFSVSPRPAYELMPVHFRDLSTSYDGLVSWLWDFGDGHTSTVCNPVHVYKQEGVYTVSLTVSEADGDTITRAETGYITVSKPILNLISPDGGAGWLSGTRQTITWASTGVSGWVRIELSRDGGSSWTTISPFTANDGSYTWLVTGPSTTQARIRVVSVLSPSVVDSSDADFTISVPATTPPAIKVTSPNRGETWAGMTKHTITWTSNGAGGLVRIELSRDGGLNWKTVVSATRNNGKYTWLVKGMPTDHAMIRVVSISNPAISDMSDANFHIR